MGVKKGWAGVQTILMALFLLFLSCCPAYGAEQLNLKPKLEKGRIFDFHVTTESTIVQTVHQKDLSVNQQIEMAMRCEITDVAADGVATLKLTFTGIRFKQDGLTGSIQYDSADPAAEISPMTLGFSVLVGAELTLKISAQGEIQDVQGVDAMLEAMLQKMGQDQEKGAVIKKTLRNQFSDQALKEMAQQASLPFPQHPVAVGEAWTNRVTLSKGYPLILESIYRFREYRDGVAYLDVDTTIAPNPEAAPMDLGAFKLNYSFSGTQTGNMQIQEAGGIACSGRVTQQLSGFIEFSSAEMKGAMEWPMRIDSVVMFDMKERK